MKRIELWLPTSELKVTFSATDGVVTVTDEMTMEKQAIKKPAGFTKVVGNDESEKAKRSV